jgi:antitoxin (DNA-binding transcriptional repressor) of toxin-antitoxin stability system
MRIPIIEAQERLDELIDLAMAGNEVFLAGEAGESIQLVPVASPPRLTRDQKRAISRRRARRFATSLFRTVCRPQPGLSL